jgi:hypothetical protein
VSPPCGRSRTLCCQSGCGDEDGRVEGGPVTEKHEAGGFEAVPLAELSDGGECPAECSTGYRGAGGLIAAIASGLVRTALAAAAFLLLAACSDSDDQYGDAVGQATAPPTAPATSEPAPEPTADGPLDHIPGDGTYEIGVDIEPGIYENDGGTQDGAPCVAVVSTTTDQVKGFVRASNTTGHGILKADTPGQYVISMFCQDWRRR